MRRRVYGEFNPFLQDLDDGTIAEVKPFKCTFDASMEFKFSPLISKL
jgi:hypothetical protein